MSGVNAAVRLVIFRVSPLFTVLLLDSWPLQSTLPAVLLSQIEMWEIVSVPAAQEVHDRVPLIDLLPDAAALQVICFRVVSALAFAVPAAPGSPVCNFTYTLVGAVNAVAPNISSHRLARFAV